jgi:hypothetical protein
MDKIAFLNVPFMKRTSNISTGRNNMTFGSIMKWAILICSMVISLLDADAQSLAFPHAEGFGRFAKGGRGGDVYHVTSLLDYHPQTDKPVPGTLRHGILSQEGPRTIVFDVSGTIALKTNLRATKSFLTIAGQTAPGDGITLKDYTFQIMGKQGAEVHDIIIRFIRFRYGDITKQSGDALSTNFVNDMIMDHVSASWSVDCIHDFRDGARFTFQWSILSEALNNSTHEKKGGHAMLSSYSHIRGNVSVHHNLMASSRNRHPTLGVGIRCDTNAIVDFRNNVVFNWSGGSNFGETRQNFVQNYYKPGKDTDYSKNKPLRMKSPRAESSKGYLAGNVFVDGPEEFNRDNYTALDYGSYGTGYTATTRRQFEWKTPFVSGANMPKTYKPEVAYNLVLRKAGAAHVRDAVDKRIIAGVKDGTSRLIDSQEQVGGWPELKSKPAPKDSDQDGMPDDWEIKNKLNPKVADDRNAYTLHRNYTNLEVYLNELVEYLYK